jgi:hypothetical protein
MVASSPAPFTTPFTHSENEPEATETGDVARWQCGRFIGPQADRVGEERLESGRIFIDTGARPPIPDIEGLRDIDWLDNAGVLTDQHGFVQVNSRPSTSTSRPHRTELRHLRTAGRCDAGDSGRNLDAGPVPPYAA